MPQQPSSSPAAAHLQLHLPLQLLPLQLLGHGRLPCRTRLLHRLQRLLQPLHLARHLGALQVGRGALARRLALLQRAEQAAGGRSGH